MPSNKSVRIGAAAFALGVSLAGPHSVAVASADEADADIASVSAGPAAGGVTTGTPASPRRAGRSARVAGAAAPAAGADRAARAAHRAAARSRTAKPSAAVRPVDTGPDVEPAAGSARAAAGRVGAILTAPPPASVAALPAAAAAAVNPAAAQTCDSCRAADATAVRLPVAGAPVAQAVSGAAFAVERLLDRAGQWLAGFPANPLTNLLSGGLWLVRRTLFPVGDAVGQWGTAACVTTGDCSGQDLTGADLVGQDLSRVNFTGATLKRADLRTANMTQANLTRADLSSASMGSATVREANLTGANLTRAVLKSANLTDVDLTEAELGYADLSGVTLNYSKLQRANLRYVKLTDAEMFGTDFSGVDLTTAALKGANLSDADLRGANLNGVVAADVDFSGANLAGATLAGAKLDRATFTEVCVSVSCWDADLTDANLTGAVLANADLSGAILNHTNFAGANLITATLTGAKWNETDCPRGGKSSTGCSPFQTVPDQKWYRPWYTFRSAATAVLPATPMAASPGAPMLGGDSTSDAKYHDGVQGTVKNFTGQRIVVATQVLATSSKLPDESLVNKAIVEPGAEVAYQLIYGGTLKFYTAPEGRPVGSPAQLYLVDYYVDKPTTKFTPPHRPVPVNTRTDWKQQTSAVEEWGSTKLKVTRELDGWTLPISQQFRDQCESGGQRCPASGSDYAIFTIEILGL